MEEKILRRKENLAYRQALMAKALAARLLLEYSSMLPCDKAKGRSTILYFIPLFRFSELKYS
ncbi:hypothetical protein [Scopulibacillus darangshiensis]|uniref:hypothetical protein n=1 Tax=Scopulibacillus darangshiensis TaxID=442528 RepID=UPI001048F517|nr:hypothetical protein [Scopulibacillus darangshiensis]